MSPPKAVVFDLGKVLLHFDYAIAAERFQQRSRLTATEVQRIIDQSPLLSDLETNRISTQTFFARLQELTGFQGDLREFEDIFCHVFTPIPPMIELHAQLRAHGVPTYIFSNTNFLQIAHIRAHYPFFAQFDGYVLSCEVGVMKPNTQIYQVVEEVSGFRGSDLLYIDDRAENVATGERIGWHAIHHEDPVRTRERVRQSGLPVKS